MEAVKISGAVIILINSWNSGGLAVVIASRSIIGNIVVALTVSVASSGVIETGTSCRRLVISSVPVLIYTSCTLRVSYAIGIVRSSVVQTGIGDGFILALAGKVIIAVVSCS